MRTDFGAASRVADAAAARAKRLRVHEIDGVRGWAALSVVVFHLFWELFGAAVPSFRSRALHYWLNGPLAVYIFFVLSGDALSWPFISTGDSHILDRTVLKRYFRLAIPIFFSSLIAYVLMRGGLMFNREAALIVPSKWLGAFLLFDPSLLSLFNFSFSEVFFNFASYPNSYNRFLWPMPVELAGSFLVFAFCYGIAMRRQAVRLTLAALGITFFISAYFCLFFAGLAFALLRQRGVFQRLRVAVFGRFVAPALIMLAIVVDTFDYALGLNLNETLRFPGRLDSVLAIVIVFCVYGNSALVEFFGNRVSRWLGKLSFPVYLLHFVVMCSLTSFLVVQAHAAGRLDATAYAAIASTSVVVTYAAAWVFEGLERYSLRRVDRAIRSALE